MKKIKDFKICLILIMVLLITIFITSCAKGVSVSLYDDNNNLLDTIKCDSYEQVDLIEASKLAKKEGYKFDCWVDEDGNVVSSLDSNKNIKLYAKFKVGKYICKFVVDGNVISEKEYLYGDFIEYPSRPRKEPDKQYTYIFDKWDHDDEEITDDITFNAEFRTVINSYVISFIDRDGKVLSRERLNYGVKPTEPNVEKVFNTKRYKYTFAGWDNEVVEVNDIASYTATYTRELINPVTKLDGLTVSFLGDSISTFYKPSSPVNSYYSEEGTYYYPKYCASMDSYEKTWWAKLCSNTGMKLGINNSWSGSAAWGANSSAAMTDGRINTLNENGDPDIVVVFIGTNDCASVYTDQYNPTNYEKALNTIIQKIRALCDADIFFVELVGKTIYKDGAYNERAKEFNAVIEKVALNEGCGIIPLQNYINKENEELYFNDGLHLSVAGASYLASLCEKYIKEYYKIND